MADNGRVINSRSTKVYLRDPTVCGHPSVEVISPQGKHRPGSIGGTPAERLVPGSLRLT